MRSECFRHFSDNIGVQDSALAPDAGDGYLLFLDDDDDYAHFYNGDHDDDDDDGDHDDDDQ